MARNNTRINSKYLAKCSLILRTIYNDKRRRAGFIRGLWLLINMSQNRMLLTSKPCKQQKITTAKEIQGLHFSSAAVVQPRPFSRSSPSHRHISFPEREEPLPFQFPFSGYRLYSSPLTAGHLGDAGSISILCISLYASCSTYMFVQRSFVVKSGILGHRRERHSRQTTFKTSSTASALQSLFFHHRFPYVLTTAPSAVCASTLFRSSR